jgi:hypothetical protein
MRKIIIPFFVAVMFSCAFAQDTELLVVDELPNGDVSEKLLDADQSESGNVIADHESNGVGSDLVEAEIKDGYVGKEVVPFSEKKMHFGGLVQLGAAALSSDESYMYGIKGNAGFAFNYFFYKRLAVQTGLDFHVLVLSDFDGMNKKIYNIEWGYFAYCPVDNYTLSFIGVSLPLALRFGGHIWAELGFRFDYAVGWTNYTIPPAILREAEQYNEKYKEEFGDPYKPETTFYPNIFAAFGFSKLVGNWILDLGLQVMTCLSDVEIDYEISEFPLFSIGVIIALWM